MSRPILLSAWMLAGFAVAAPARGDQPVVIPMPGDSVLLPGDTAGDTASPAIPMPGEASDAVVPTPGGKASTPAASALLQNLAPKLRGYVENTLNVEQRTDQERLFLLNATRMRLNLAGKPNDAIDYGMGIVGLLYSGNTDVTLGPYLPAATQASLFPGDPTLDLPPATSLLRYPLDNHVYLQELFATLHLPHVKVRIGRHKLYTGTGYAFNPIDLFNRKDPLDPTYEVDGIDALSLSVDLPAEVELQAVAKLGARLDLSDYLGRVRVSVAGWDLALQYTHHLRHRIDWIAVTSPRGVAALTLGAPLDSFERQFRWHLIAGEVAGELFGIGVHAEGGYAFIEAKGDPGSLAHAAQDHERFLVGLDYTFDNQLYVIAEYMRIGQGRQRNADIDLNDRLGMFTGETLAIGSDTLFAGASYPITELWELALYGIVNLDDPSTMVTPWVRAGLYENVSLSMSGVIPIGDGTGQLGQVGPGGFVRLRVSF